MTQKYFYHEHLADYAEMKEKGLMSRGELYGDPDFSHFCLQGLPGRDASSAGSAGGGPRSGTGVWNRPGRLLFG